MIRRPPRSTLSSSSAASDVYKRQLQESRFRSMPCASLGQRKSLGFQFHKHSPDAANGTVEFGRCGHLEIGEHPRRPGLEMPLEESRLFGKVGLELAAREA